MFDWFDRARVNNTEVLRVTYLTVKSKWINWFKCFFS